MGKRTCDPKVPADGIAFGGWVLGVKEEAVKKECAVVDQGFPLVPLAISYLKPR